MAIKPCKYCLKTSCDYYQYCPQFQIPYLSNEMNGSVCCCYARNVSRVHVQSFDCNYYIVTFLHVVCSNCNIIAILKSCDMNEVIQLGYKLVVV